MYSAYFQYFNFQMVWRFNGFVLVSFVWLVGPSKNMQNYNKKKRIG